MNQITMKLNADKLIMMALQEDITSEDVSTNAETALRLSSSAKMAMR